MVFMKFNVAFKFSSSRSTFVAEQEIKYEKSSRAKGISFVRLSMISLLIDRRGSTSVSVGRSLAFQNGGSPTLL